MPDRDDTCDPGALTASHDPDGNPTLSAGHDLSGGATRVVTDVAPVTAGAPLPAVPGYALVEEVGSGGMGAVYRARELALDRDVAVKLLHDRYPANSAAARRFVGEARITSQLQHPAIPPVHHVGTLPDGRPFLAMKLIKGDTLADLLDREPADRGRFAAVFAQVCQAVAYAHNRRVIHRDLKPGNVMVGAFGEVQVMDWGLAKVLASGGREPAASEPTEDERTEIRTAPDPEMATQAGSVLGTLAFMAPEQAQGAVDETDERSDVFGLGAVLCTILTGKPPYSGAGADALRLKAIRGETGDALARLDACGADPELVALCKHCLATDRDARPRDAGEVAGRVAAYQAEVEARLRRAELERAKADASSAEQRKRRRVQLALAAAVLLIATGGGASAWYQREQARAEAARAGRQAATAQEVGAALETARVLIDLGWTRAMELEQWEVTIRQASLALERARALLEAGEPTDEVRERVREMEHTLKEAAADLHLGRGIEDCLATLFETHDKHTVYADAALQMDRLLRERGFPVAGPGRDRTVEWARAHKLRVSIQTLLTFLSFWHPDAEMKLHFTEVAQAIDEAQDAKYRQWLRAIILPDPAALTRLSADPAVAELAPTALALVGVAIGARGEPEVARVRLKEWQARHPDNFWLNYQLAVRLQSVKTREQEALGYARVAAAIRKGSPRAYKILASICFTVREFKEAIAAYQRAIELDPNDATLRSLLGRVLLATGDRVGAIAAYREAVRLDGNRAHAHMDLGLVLRQQKGDLDEALAALREAGRLAPKSAVIQYHLGFTLRMKGDLKGAVAVFQQAVKLEPKYSPNSYALGVALRQQGDVDGAVAAFQQAVKLEPKSGNAQVYQNALDDALRLQAERDRTAPPPRNAKQD